MRTLFLMVALVVSMGVNAQSPALKIGFADVDYIFNEMPEFKQIEAELQAVQKQLKTQIDKQAAEFKTKLEEYNRYGAETLPAVRANTERELQQLQANLQQLQEDAQTTIQQKQAALMDPVYKKISKAIEDVAKENGFSLILTTQVGGLDVVLYGEEKLDTSDLVLKKMGVTPKTQTPAPQN